VINLATVKFGKLKDKVSDFQEFVKEKKKVEGKAESDSIEYGDMKTDELKMFVKKYLHKQSLDIDYRATVSSGTVSVVERKIYEAES
jgi:hypothetical protein